MSRIEDIVAERNRLAAANGATSRMFIKGGGFFGYGAADASRDLARQTAAEALPAAGGMTLLKGGAILAGIGLAGWAAASLFSRPSWTQRIEDERAAAHHVHR